MKESHGEGLANQSDPESCGGARKSDGDDKKRFHGSFSRLRAEASAVASQSERRPVRGWMALTVISFHPTVQRSTHASNRRTVHRNYTLV